MKKDRLILIAVVTAFLLPIIFAAVLQPWKDDLVAKGSLSFGKLVTPQIELTELATLTKLRGRWTLVAFADTHCDEKCIETVYKIQQIRLTQGEESKRIERLLISNGKLPNKDLQALDKFPGTQFLRLDDAQYEKLSSIMLGQINNKLSENIYLIDTLGYYMMTFSNELVPKGIITDLKHLLRNSRIG